MATRLVTPVVAYQGLDTTRTPDRGGYQKRDDRGGYQGRDTRGGYVAGRPWRQKGDDRSGLPGRATPPWHGPRRLPKRHTRGDRGPQRRDTVAASAATTAP